jgi:hypothetical protein
LYGPAGAAVWSAPTIDAKRGAPLRRHGRRLYLPAAETSDAVIAFDWQRPYGCDHRSRPTTHSSAAAAARRPRQPSEV